MPSEAENRDCSVLPPRIPIENIDTVQQRDGEKGITDVLIKTRGT